MKSYPYIAICALLSATSPSQVIAKRNILVIVADDLGKELLNIYNIPVEKRAKTPNIDRLAQRGVTFDNVWGAPLSAPVRAAMLTGRHGHNTGIVSLDITLPTSETTIFEALPEGYSSAVIGKWHLSTVENFAPSYGIDHFAGFYRGGGVRDYWRWQFTKEGRTQLSQEYITTTLTNEAKGWIESQKSGEWLCWLAYNAPHTPIHLPPQYMHSQKLSGTSEDIERDPLPYHLAMIESMDYEIGRLLESVDDNTTIIFVGDNGSGNNVLQAPYPTRHGKGSVYEGGVAIPMIVCGAGVESMGVRSEQMVSAVDMFPTIMEIVGVKMPSYEDAYSFEAALRGGESQRRYNFAEIMHQRFGYMNALSEGEYKIITSGGKTTALYALKDDPFEMRNLLQGTLNKEQKQRLQLLEEELRRMNVSVKTLPKNQSNAKGGTRQGQGQQMRKEMNRRL